MARRPGGKIPGTGYESPELFRLLVATVGDCAIFALDPTGHVVTWNAGAERIKGYSREEILGQHFSVFYPDAEREAGKPQRELRVAAREGHFKDEGWRLRKDGSRFWADVMITALRARDGSLVGFAKVTRDLTERKEAEERAIEDARRIAREEALRQVAEERTQALGEVLDRLAAQTEELEKRRAEAETANRAKSAFLASMSHELRTPLNAITGYTDLLLLGMRGPLTSAQTEDLERIRRSGRHLLGLIDDLLNFVPVDAGRVSFKLEPVAIAEIMDDVRAMAEPQAGSKELTLTVAPCDPELQAVADGDRVAQIVLNLLVNAIKFTPPGGRISVESASTEGGGVEILVRDTGPGIEPERLEAIFEPFVQLDAGLTRGGGGLGLGLAVSRDLARGMGGELSVESEPGGGTTFTLRLPSA